MLWLTLGLDFGHVYISRAPNCDLDGGICSLFLGVCKLNFYLVSFVPVLDHYCSGNTGTLQMKSVLFLSSLAQSFSSAFSPVQWKASVRTCHLYVRGRHTLWRAPQNRTHRTSQNNIKLLPRIKLSIADYLKNKMRRERRRLVVRESEQELSSQTLLMIKEQQAGRDRLSRWGEKGLLSATMANTVPMVAVWGKCFAVWVLKAVCPSTAGNFKLLVT